MKWSVGAVCGYCWRRRIRRCCAGGRQGADDGLVHSRSPKVAQFPDGGAAGKRKSLPRSNKLTPICCWIWLIDGIIPETSRRCLLGSWQCRLQTSWNHLVPIIKELKQILANERNKAQIDKFWENGFWTKMLWRNETMMICGNWRWEAVVNDEDGFEKLIWLLDLKPDFADENH